MAATSYHQVTESVGDDFLTCGICFKVFNDPRILPCLHTYCFQCICSHASGAKRDGHPVVCPECHEPLSDSVSSLKVNCFINGLTEVIKEKSLDKVSCISCHLRGIKITAQVKCLDCGDYLCSTCSDGHNASSLTWTHEKLALDEIKKGIYDEKLRQKQKIKRLEHVDKGVEFYCEHCSKSICMTCILLDHRDHQCRTISDSVCEKKSNMTTLAGKLREKSITLTKEEDRVANLLKELVVTETREKLEIEKQTEQEIEKINAKKKTAMEKVERNIKDSRQDYEGRLESLQLQKRLVNNCVAVSDRIIQNGKDEELLMLEAVITDRLIYLQTQGKTENEGNKTYAPSLTESENTKEEVRHSPRVGSPDNLREVTPSVDIHVKKSLLFGAETRNRQGDNNMNFQKQEYPLDPDVGEKENESKLKLRNSFFAEFPTDFRRPNIKGIAYSPSIGLILSDNGNKKLKIMNKSGKLQQEITRPDLEPYAVAVAGDVIGVISENYLMLFSPKGILKQKIKLTETKPKGGSIFTFSLAASVSFGFVVGNISQEDKLVFFTRDGRFARYLYCSIELPLAALSVTPSGDLVLSEWGKGRIRVIAREGKPRFCTEDAWWKPNGTCTSKDGIIFIADYTHGQIQACTSKGEFFLRHSTRSEKMKNPSFIVIDENDVLYVADYAGYICVYSFD